MSGRMRRYIARTWFEINALRRDGMFSTAPITTKRTPRTTLVTMPKPAIALKYQVSRPAAMVHQKIGSAK
jgi:hypothetical protein